MSPAEWDELLPTWNGRDGKRGLKGWSSKTKRGNWCIQSVCGRVVNQCIDVYVETLGVPPVLEGKRNKAGLLVVDDKGLDLYKSVVLNRSLGLL